MADMLGDLLGKLSRKTGREWTMLDLMKLAQKLPDLQKNGDIDSLFSELGEMGLEMSDETKEKIKNKLSDGEVSQEQAEEMIQDLPEPKVKEVSGKSRKKAGSRRHIRKKRKK